MAKKALLDVLEQTIGKYVKNLDAESLNVAVWSGKIELHSLQLDVDAVNHELDRQAAEAPNLALPFRVLSGEFESFQVDVPWASLTSRPVILRAQGLKIVVKPFDRLSQHTEPASTEVVETEGQQEAKAQQARYKSIEASDKYRIQAYAMRKLSETEAGEGTKSSFSSRLVRRIIENIQIEIGNVRVSLTDEEGSAGVVLQSLALVTTDKDGNRVFVDRTSNKSSPDNSFLYKKLLIDGFGIYLDHDDIFMSTQNLKPIVEGDQIEDETGHSYVLAPLSFQANLRQADSTVCIDYAKYQLSSELSSLSIILSRSQLDLFRAISKKMSSDNVLIPLFPEYRPLSRVSKHTVRQWWKYAVRCIGRLNGRRSWFEFFMAFKKRKKYIPLYKRQAHHATCSWIKCLSKDEQEELKNIEGDRTISVEGLMAWRSLADGQVDKEKAKHDSTKESSAKSAIFSSIFGSSQKPKTETMAEENPPVKLTQEELKELENMSKEKFLDSDLSKDSKLCDVNFMLSALKINLTSYDLRHIAALDMGVVSMDFEAAADGAYTFLFDLSHLEIQDRATPKSLFPSILRNVESRRSESTGVFNLQVSKTKTGDKALKLKLAAFEAVASQILLRELQRFFIDNTSRTVTTKAIQNPILAQSLSGSVDLFYDASQGEGAQESQPFVLESHETTATAASDFSNVLFDAWKEKTATKASWAIDVDIKAPIVIIPERCNDPHANVLVFDLGHFQLVYGNTRPSKKVSAWFTGNRLDSTSKDLLDSGSLTINDLTFKVGVVSGWKQLLDPIPPSSSHISAIIQPISMVLDFGIESSAQFLDAPRFCCMGVIPAIYVTLSPTQGSKVFSVAKAWNTFMHDIKEDSEGSKLTSQDTGKDSSGQALLASRSKRLLSSHSTGNNNETEEGETPRNFPVMFFQVGLQRLSVVASTDPSNTIEGHLVSVYVSSCIMLDGSSASGVQMGWFWILDRIQSEFSRKQRLLAHSNLPKSPQWFAESGKYDILEELQGQGAFELDYAGSTELADISYHSVGVKGKEEDLQDSVLDARFSSLSIHWNPHAVKSLSALIDVFSSVADKFGALTDNRGLMVSPAAALRETGTPPENTSVASGIPAKPSKMLIKARMQSLDIYLNSARDDLPLFMVTVVGAVLSLVSTQSSGSDIEASLSLGDVRISTPEGMGATLPTYRTLLGLAPGRSESLLTVKYYQGEGSIQRMLQRETDTSKLEAFADVELSPMRLSYIHSQVMALVEYITEGILGVLTAKAASSAAQAAKEMASSVEGEKLFVVRATSFGLVLPQAAHKTHSLTIHAGSLGVEYFMYPEPSGSKALVSLMDVSLRDSQGEPMQEYPIRMSVDVTLPSEQLEGYDAQAMTVNTNISEANFILTKLQYAQILLTLDENMGAVELFLRNDDISTVLSRPSNRPNPPSVGLSVPNTAEMTHAGVDAIERLRRLYLNVRIESLSLQLCGDGAADPLAKFAAVSADVCLRQIPDDEKMSCDISLGNLVCEDVRHKASTRQYRYLIDQGKSSATTEPTDEDFFRVSYISAKDECSVDLRVGSPQLVLIPDAIAEVLAFVQTNRDSTSAEADLSRDMQIETQTVEQVHVVSNDSGEVVEAALVETAKTFSTRISITTQICRVVLVDLGSQINCDPNSSLNSMSGHGGHLTETLVLQGIFSSHLSLSTDDSSSIVGADFNGQGDSMEIFSAFGTDMKSPLQILEPSEGSVHGSLKRTKSHDATEIEVRAAALTPFEFTFSMHNAALLSAILNSLGETLSSGDDGKVNEALGSLSPAEKARIETLASALESTQKSDAMPYQESLSMGDNSSVLTGERFDKRSSWKKIQIKITMPETTITVVNDLQGLDEALFRLSVVNFVAGGEFLQQLTNKSTFDFHVNTSILADYFDGSLNLWSKLLTMPWEITLKGIRAPSRRFNSDRLSTTIDLESFPCAISFSEQFLVSLASAYRMWSIYSVATDVQVEEDLAGTMIGDSDSNVLKHSMAASAARNLITSLPYAVENYSGIDATFSLHTGKNRNSPCPNGKVQYFRFEPPSGHGYGGKRVYGQDVGYDKSITLFLGNSKVQIGHLDSELGMPRRTHELDDGAILVTQVRKEGKTTVLHLSSSVCFLNETSIPFCLAIKRNQEVVQVGTCLANNVDPVVDHFALSTNSGPAAKESKSFSLPLDVLTNFTQDWTAKKQSSLSLVISPRLPDIHSPQLRGSLRIEPSLKQLQKSNDNTVISKEEVTCRPIDGSRSSSPLVLQVSLRISLLDETHISVDACFEPRAVIENRMPVDIHIRTPMPNTFSSSSTAETLGNDVLYELKQGERIEIFTAGPSLAVSIRTSKKPVAGTSLGWLEGGWIDLPLVPAFRLPEPIMCLLPFVSSSSEHNAGFGGTGSEIFIAEGFEALTSLSNTENGKPNSVSAAAAIEKLVTPAADGPVRTFFITVCFYGIDHTGDILFESQSAWLGSLDTDSSEMSLSPRRKTLKQRISHPLSAFSSDRHRRRISLLPSGQTPLRILQMTMEGDSGLRRSMPFLTEQLVIGEGGVDTTPIHWEDKRPSGYYAYRTILNEHQSEIHVVPEFIVFNGSKDVVLVKERGKPEIIIESDCVSPLRVDSRDHGLEVALNFIEMECRSNFIQVGGLGLKVAILNSSAGYPIGSVCIQTVIDTHGDARLVVKIGEVQTGSLAPVASPEERSMFRDDFFRFRVRWTELQLILNETKQVQDTKWNVTKAVFTVRDSLLTPTNALKKRGSNEVEMMQFPVAAVIFSRFTFDYQRVFKDSAALSVRDGMMSPERSQISLIVHNVAIKDLTPDTPFPMVFDCSSKISFLDLCIRIRGPLDADLVNVDLVDLNLAHVQGMSERMILTTSEAYVWRLLDLANRILAASGDFTGVSLNLEEDKVHGGYMVKVEDSRHPSRRDELKYTPPKSDTLYDVKLARVSPFTLLVTFQRNPQSSRYQKAHNVRGATLMNYFTQKLKFTIDKAELNFARYADRTLKGPPDRLLESLCAVYASRMKFKLVTLLTAASLQDWKFLAARDNGDDEYAEGDILRATGNLAGKSAGLMFKRVGQGLGTGVSGLSRAVGNSIESTTEKVGAGRVGAGVNSVVSGVGDGVGDALSGVGSGAGKVLKGAGQGIGQVFGGVAGGALHVGKGIGKGLTKGDGKAVVAGFTKGATSLGGGLAQGAESAVVGAADGFLSAGKGLFSGVKNVGRGFGDAFTGKKPHKKQPKR